MTSLTIDFSAVNPLSSGNSPGEIGENNAVELHIIPETEMMNSPEIVSYIVMFGTKDGTVPSAVMPQTDTYLTLSLTDSITKYRAFTLQLWAADGTGKVIMKSKTAHLFLKPSVSSDYIGDEGGTLLAQIAEFLNTHYSNEDIDLLLSGVLPAVTAEDNGDFLCVVNGEWQKKKLNSAEEVIYIGQL